MFDRFVPASTAWSASARLRGAFLVACVALAGACADGSPTGSSVAQAAVPATAPVSGAMEGARFDLQQFGTGALVGQLVASGAVVHRYVFGDAQLASPGAITVSGQPVTEGSCMSDRIYYPGVKYTMECIRMTGRRPGFSEVACDQTVGTDGAGIRCDLTRLSGGVMYGSTEVILSYSWTKTLLSAATLSSISGPATVSAVGPQSFTVTSTGGEEARPRTYAWEVSRDAGATWKTEATQSNGTADTYNRIFSKPDGILRVRVRVTTADGQTLVTAPLAVDTRQVPPLTVSPISGPNTVAGGRLHNKYTWSVTTSDNGLKPVRTFTWQVSTDGGVTWTDAATQYEFGSLSSSYSLSAIGVAKIGSFKLRVNVWAKDGQVAQTPVLSVMVT